MNYYFLACVALSVLSSPFAQAAPAKQFTRLPELQCPEEISLESDQVLKKVPSGWRKFVDQTNFRPLLNGVNFYTDAPEKLAMLRPDDKGIVYLSNDSHESWVVCTYTQTLVQLTKVIPRKFSACRAVFHAKAAVDRNPLLGFLDYVECRE